MGGVRLRGARPRAGCAPRRTRPLAARRQRPLPGVVYLLLLGRRCRLGRSRVGTRRRDARLGRRPAAREPCRALGAAREALKPGRAAPSAACVSPAGRVSSARWPKRSSGRRRRSWSTSTRATPASSSVLPDVGTGGTSEFGRAANFCASPEQGLYFGYLLEVRQTR